MDRKTQAPERFNDTDRNLILNRTVTDLENIINGHNPETHGTICQEVWDRLDQMALELETRPEAAQVRETSLVWEEVKGEWLADCYRLQQIFNTGVWIVIAEDVELGRFVEPENDFDLRQAKAAAQADFDQRIRAALEPDTVTDDLSKSIADFVSRQEPLGAEFEQVLADNIEELYETQPDTAADTVTGWQDISTAPKDGTWFLGYTPRRVHGWPWQNSKGAILSFRWWGKGKGDRIPWFSNMDGFPQPTHWMPLPPAPKKEKK